MSDSLSVRVAIATFNAVLHCYPGAFRNRFGAEICATFEQMCRDAETMGGARSVAGACIASSLDVIQSAPGERWCAHSRQLNAARQSGDLITIAATTLFLGCVPLIIVGRILAGGARVPTMTAPMLCVVVLHCAAMHVVVRKRASVLSVRIQKVTELAFQFALSACAVVALRAPDVFVRQLAASGMRSLFYGAAITIPVCIVLASTERVRSRLAFATHRDL